MATQSPEPILDERAAAGSPTGALDTIGAWTAAKETAKDAEPHRHKRPLGGPLERATDWFQVSGLVHSSSALLIAFGLTPNCRATTDGFTPALTAARMALTRAGGKVGAPGRDAALRPAGRSSVE